MGKVLSVAAGKVQRFNVENRAQKVISRDKPTPAPKFEANIKDLERILKDHPEIVEQASKKDAVLDERLRKVFVTSSDYLEQRRVLNPDKPLPLSRQIVEEFEYGHQEPESKRVSLGKCTLRQAVQFIEDNQTKPAEWTAERIANEFKLKQENVENILEHFRMFTVHIPTKPGPTKKILMNPMEEQKKKFDKLLEGTTKNY